MLDVLPFGGFGMALEENRLAANERFKLYLHNQGSAPLTLALQARDLEGQLRFAMPAPTVTLAPGQRSIIEGSVQSRRLILWGKPREYAFDLVARARTPAGFTAAVRGYVTLKPSLPAWAPVALFTLMGTALLLATLIIFALSDQSVVPSILTFNASSDRVIQGDSLTLTWDVSNASELILLANGSVVAQGIDPQAGALPVDTRSYTGAVLLTLRALNHVGSSEASQVVEIEAPLDLSYFTVEPTQLVRYVVQTITVNWSVTGAVTTRLSGLETFNPSQLISNYGASGTVQIAGIALQPIAITLTAQDSSGRSVESVFNVDVIDPRCLPGGADVTLYSDPNPNAQVVGTVVTETVVTVDAQDGSGQWLRVLLSGGAQGWGARNLFVCENTFDPGQLQRVVQLPTQPAPTATGMLPQSTLPAMTPTPLTPIPPTATGRFGG
jgi:hypothetical protein